VTLNARNGKVARSENTVVSDFKTDDDGLSWTQNDAYLPFPVLALHDDWPQFPPYSDPKNRMSFVWTTPEPDWNYTNAATQMALDDGGFYHALDQEPLKITGLAKGNYQLKINGQVVGEFSAKELHQGVNLAEYHTPMLEQSYRELALVWKQVEWRFFAWRGIQLELSGDHDPGVQQAINGLVAALQAQEQDIVQQQYAAAVPQTTHYELIPAGPVIK
jgi:hypothetical protein